MNSGKNEGVMSKNFQETELVYTYIPWHLEKLKLTGKRDTESYTFC